MFAPIIFLSHFLSPIVLLVTDAEGWMDVPEEKYAVVNLILHILDIITVFLYWAYMAQSIAKRQEYHQLINNDNVSDDD